MNCNNYSTPSRKATQHAPAPLAADDWDEPMQVKSVRPARPDSYEWLFHQAGLTRALLHLGEGGDADARDALSKSRLERAIGVVYRPDTERQSHYSWARLPDQFDAVLHFDETRAVEPLEYGAEWEAGEVPETFPFGV